MFYIQACNPRLENKINMDDKCLSDAIESIFPLNTENAILMWNDISLPLSYKYDISYMMEDIIKLLNGDGVFMLINNCFLRENEKNWLEIMLRENENRKEWIRQINRAEIDREYTEFYLRLKFFVSSDTPEINCCTRVPVEMRVFPKNGAPIQFLLHCIKGYISELEIFRADSSKISENLKIENEKRDIIFSWK